MRSQVHKRTGSFIVRRKRGEEKRNFLSWEISGWGFQYSLKTYALQSGLVLAAIAAVGKLYMLSTGRLVVLICTAMTAFPMIVKSQFRFLASGRDFREAVQYMEQMILFFKQSPKILSAMKGTMITAEGALKKRLQDAIFIIEHDFSGDDVYEKGLAIIEEAYPCARIRTLHRFMMQVEGGNSRHYQQGADSLYFDIQSWAGRVYQYQKELKNIKMKLSLIMVMSVGIAAFFSRLLLKAQQSLPEKYELNLIKSGVYQNSSLIYLLLFIGLYILIASKITGNWLVDDRSRISQEAALKNLDYVENFKWKKERKKAVPMSFCGLGIAVVSAAFQVKAGIAAGLILALLILYWPKLLLKKRRGMVERALMKDFPVWMREVSIHLYDMVPVRAVEMTLHTATPLMQRFLEQFLNAIEKNPASLEPYLNIFHQYHAEELTASFKTLFTIQNLSAEDAQRQIMELVRRNQKQLEQAERLRNADYLSGITLISILPMLMMSFYLIVNLLLILAGFMGLSKGVF
ncbi:MAG: hypothetical protein ACI4W2_06870 [Eubacterium sp.]